MDGEPGGEIPKQFDEMIEVLHEGYILVDEDANIHDVNPAYCEMVGYTREELLDMDLHDVRPGMTLEYQREFIQEIKKQGSVEFETQHLAKDGSVVDLKASAALIEKDGKIYLAGFVRDITGEKVAEKKLQESKQRWQGLIEQNPQCVVILTDEIIRYINRAGAELLGGTPDEIIGRKVYDFVPEAYEKRVENRLPRIENQQELTADEQQIIRLDGEKRTVIVHSVPVKYKGEKSVQTVLQDVTELKEKEQQLRESEEKWHHLIEGNPQPVQVTVDGEIVFINDAGAKLYGAEDPEQVTGMSVFEFSHPDYKDKVQDRKHRLENNLPVENIHEHKIRRLDGASRYIEVHSIPIQYQGEQAIQTVLYDITERKEKESLIEASLKEKEVLLKEIHHRVKNNMAVISGLLELQAMSTDDEKLKDLLKKSQLRISSMAMVHEKLYQTESFSGLSFDEYVEELIQTIKQTVDVQTNNIEIAFRSEEVSLDITQAIPAALIINEVVVNSFKHAFTDKESGEITIFINQTNGSMQVAVKDNGVGLPDDFDISDQNTLGMNLIQTLSDQLGGNVSFDSPDNGSGTIFELLFEID